MTCIAGFSSEALALTLGLLEGGAVHPQDLWLQQSGGPVVQGIQHALPAHMVDFIDQQNEAKLQKVCCVLPEWQMGSGCYDVHVVKQNGGTLPT